MPWEPYVEFANFICKFGDNTNLLDLANPVVLPAFINHDIRYEIMGTKNFLYQTRLVDLDFNGNRELCIVGMCIQETKLKSEQTFDEDKGLVPNPREMDTARSAFFVLILSDHKLLYYHQTPSAPSVGTFRTLVERNIRYYYQQYVKDSIANTIATLQSQGSATSRQIRDAAKAARQVLPRMTLEIVPLATEDDFAAFIARLSLLTEVRIELLATNDENDSDPFFDQVREKKESIDSDKTALTHSNLRSGLNKAEATVQLAAAAEQGNSHISLRGKDEAGIEVARNAANFKTRVPVPDADDNNVTDSPNNLVRRMYLAFRELITNRIRIDELDEATNASKQAKIDAVRERYAADITSG